MGITLLCTLIHTEIDSFGSGLDEVVTTVVDIAVDQVGIVTG